LRATEHPARKIQTKAQAEAMGYKLMVIGGGIMGVGLLLCLTILLVGLGLPLLILGALVVLADIGWMFRIMKQGTERVRCPYCRKCSEVFHGVSLFTCDVCDRLVERHGQVVAVHPRVAGS